MNRKYFLETGNWNAAANALVDRHPDAFLSHAAAKDFLRVGALREFGNVATEDMNNQEPWFYSPVCTMPSSYGVEETATERFERIQFTFWINVTHRDRSDIEITP
jgi:hypothetical protein